jgi:serine/threonine protein kinase
VQTLSAGQQLDHYQILAHLGSGAFSETYEARDGRDGRLVVLKCPDPALLGDQSTFERFRREIVIGRLLDHPNIQRALDGGETRSIPYLVLEYVDGERLRDFLERSGPLSADAAAGFARQLAGALGYAHARQVYHRDLKPENVLITADHQLKVIDFGIAFLAGARRITWRFLSNAVGTPDYMAPEQIQGGRGDARTDIYALGAMLYEMLAGRPPFQGDNALAIMNQHLNATPPPPSRFRPVPEGLDAISLRALRKNPDERYQTAAELAADLDRYQELRVADFGLGAERAVEPGHPNRSLAVLVAALALGFLVVAVLVVALSYLAAHH